MPYVIIHVPKSAKINSLQVRDALIRYCELLSDLWSPLTKAENWYF